jgi:hypothetical protein
MSSTEKLEYNRTKDLKKRVGITLQEYDKLLKQQEMVCAICKRVETRKNANGSTWSLSVDHCHTTGVIRGLLCGRCNTGLGMFLDDPTLLENAISYLKVE